MRYLKKVTTIRKIETTSDLRIKTKCEKGKKKKTVKILLDEKGTFINSKISENLSDILFLEGMHNMAAFYSIRSAEEKVDDVVT